MKTTVIFPLNSGRALIDSNNREALRTNKKRTMRPAKEQSTAGPANKQLQSVKQFNMVTANDDLGVHLGSPPRPYRSAAFSTIPVSGRRGIGRARIQSHRHQTRMHYEVSMPPTLPGHAPRSRLAVIEAIFPTVVTGQAPPKNISPNLALLKSVMAQPIGKSTGSGAHRLIRPKPQKLCVGRAACAELNNIDQAQAIDPTHVDPPTRPATVGGARPATVGGARPAASTPSPPRPVACSPAPNHPSTPNIPSGPTSRPASRVTTRAASTPLARPPPQPWTQPSPLSRDTSRATLDDMDMDIDEGNMDVNKDMGVARAVHTPLEERMSQMVREAAIPPASPEFTGAQKRVESRSTEGRGRARSAVLRKDGRYLQSTHSDSPELQKAISALPRQAMTQEVIVDQCRKRNEHQHIRKGAKLEAERRAWLESLPSPATIYQNDPPVPYTADPDIEVPGLPTGPKSPRKVVSRPSPNPHSAQAREREHRRSASAGAVKRGGVVKDIVFKPTPKPQRAASRQAPKSAGPTPRSPATPASRSPATPGLTGPRSSSAAPDVFLSPRTAPVGYVSSDRWRPATATPGSSLKPSPTRQTVVALRPTQSLPRTPKIKTRPRLSIPGHRVDPTSPARPSTPMEGAGMIAVGYLSPGDIPHPDMLPVSPRFPPIETPMVHGTGVMAGDIKPW